MLRALACAAPLLALAGCHKEPTFDERYEAARATIEKTAKDIDMQARGSGVPSATADDEGVAK